MVRGTIIDDVAVWVAGLSLEDLPERVVDKIRLQVATSVAAAAAAPWHGPSRGVLTSCRGAEGRALIFATGEGLAPAEAAYVNSAFAMSLDFDDYLLSGHTGHSAVQVPLAFAETIDEVIVATAAANEVMGRLSTSCLFGPLNGQMSSYIHNIGAAVALGKVLALPPRQLASALALSLAQPSFCLAPGFWHEGSKTLTASSPTLLGLRAALLAKAGVDGPSDILEHPLGFWSVFSFRPFPGLFDALGQVWFSETLCYKRFPGTSYISAAVEAALEASGGRSLGAGEVERVEVATTVLSSTLDSVGAAALDRSPLDLNAVNFSLRLSVASALFFGELTPGCLRPESLALAEAEIRALATKVDVIHDWAQSARLFTTSPAGLGMLSELGVRGLWRLLSHVRKMSATGGKRGRNSQRFRGLLQGFGSRPPTLLASMAGGVTAKDLDLTLFKMYQSARLVLTTTGGSREVQIDIPAGACGRPWTETMELVRWRCEEAFGGRGERVWGTIWEPGHDVADLYETVRAT